MAIAIAEQTSVFFRSLLLGAVLGCLYDFFRITRLAFIIPSLLVLVEDLLFFLFSTVILFGFMLENRYGQIRYFILLGVVLGWTIYYFSVGSLVMKCSAGIIRLFRAVFAFCWRPFAWAGRRLSDAGRAAGGRMQEAAAGLKYRLKFRVLMMYNKTNRGQRDGEKNERKGPGEG